MPYTTYKFFVPLITEEQHTQQESQVGDLGLVYSRSFSVMVTETLRPVGDFEWFCQMVVGCDARYHVYCLADGV